MGDNRIIWNEPRQSFVQGGGDGFRTAIRLPWRPHPRKSIDENRRPRVSVYKFVLEFPWRKNAANDQQEGPRLDMQPTYQRHGSMARRYV